MIFWKLYARNMRQMPRIPTVLIFGIAMPTIQILLFGTVFSNTTELPGHPYQGESYYAYIAPAIILLTCVLGMANSSAAFIVDLRTGYFDKLRTTPAHPSLVIFARLLAEMTRVTGQAILVLLLAMALDARIATGLAGAAAIVGASVVFAAMTTGLLVMILAMKTRSDQATQAMFPLFFVLIFLSTAFMPENLLPGWLQTVVKANPVDYMIQGLRSLVFETWSAAWLDLAIGLGAAAFIAVVLAAFNVAVYRRMLG